MGMDLRGSILLKSENFASKFWEMIKMQFLCIFGVKNTNSTKMD